MDVRFDIVYPFLQLPYHEQINIILELELIEPSDLSLPNFEMYRKAFVKARESGKIEELYDAVQKVKDSINDEV